MNKFRNVKTVVDGITFASKAEARRYQQLLLLERAGEIKDIVLQPRFDIVVNEQKIGKYVADFQYTDKLTKKTIVEDVKGFVTPLYRWKKKLMNAVHNIDVVEIKT